MVRKEGRSFWLVVGTFACIHPIIFLALQNLLLGAYGGMSVGKWLLTILLLPLVAFATSVTIMPVSLLIGAISAVWSRRTETTARWVVRSALVSGVVVTFSYIPIYMIVRFDMAVWLTLLVTIPNAAIAGAVAAWASRGWRPRMVPVAAETTVGGCIEVKPEGTGNGVAVAKEDAPDTVPAVQRKGSFLGLVLVFTIAGPLIAGATLGLFLTVFVIVAGNPQDVLAALISVMAVGLVLIPLGGVSALIAGIISGLVSRGTLSTRRWLAYSALAGAMASAISVITPLLVFLFGESFSFWGSIGVGLATMFVLGAMASFACGLICRGFRPRML